MYNKELLKIENIETIEEIFEKYLWFLPSSVQKINLAYSLQYFFFMIQLYNTYKLPNPAEYIFIQQLTILGHSICESVLFLVLKKEKKIKENKKYSLLTLANIAKKTKPSIIDKTLYNNLKRLNSRRNLLHPKKQNKIYIEIFRFGGNSVIRIVRNLLDATKGFYQKI